jgi:hypothetical protein
MSNDKFMSDNQFVFSFELLQLLEWLMEHHPEEIKKLIHRSLSQGLTQNIQNADNLIDGYSIEDMQNGIIDFFNLMEVLLVEALNERQISRTLHSELIPTINHVDRATYDSTTLSTSVERATSKINKHPQENPQTILYKELLKNWKPAKKTSLN